MFEEAERRVARGEAPSSVADWLVGEGLSAGTAHELVAVLVGRPPDVVPASVFPLQSAVRPDGQELFDQMTKGEQDELLTPEVAEAVRSGKVELEDLVVEHQMETEENFIAQATPQDLGIPTQDR